METIFDLENKLAEKRAVMTIAFKPSIGVFAVTVRRHDGPNAYGFGRSLPLAINDAFVSLTKIGSEVATH